MRDCFGPLRDGVGPAEDDGRKRPILGTFRNGGVLPNVTDAVRESTRNDGSEGCSTVTVAERPLNTAVTDGSRR